jgi:predicted branched-subunit amino acid permease
MREATHSFRDGARRALPVVAPTAALGISFGVLAKPIMGPVAPVVMSILVFSGGAQFAALSVLQASGTGGAAFLAGMLMNSRWVPMSLAVRPSLRGGRARAVVESQAIVDASFVFADRGDGTFDRELLIGATFAQAVGWIGGTLAGVLAGGFLGDPAALGLDAIFPAFYLLLLVEAAQTSRARVAAGLAALIAFALMPFAPPGVPIVVASAAALLGLRR